jgi:hypothetical protein
MGIKYWEFHGSFGYTWYAPVRRDQYQTMLDDTAFFGAFYDLLNPALHLIDAHTDPIPANETYQASAFFFGPALPFLYVGGSFLWRDSWRDLYLPLADTDSGTVVYAFLPYQTPHREGSINVIASLIRRRAGVGEWINDAAVKISFPVWSFGSYKGYYQPPGGNLLAGFQGFYYDYHGTGALTIDARVTKELPASITAALAYSLVSMPYVAYHFLGSDGYQYHTISLSISKDLGAGTGGTRRP